MCHHAHMSDIETTKKLPIHLDVRINCYSEYASTISPMSPQITHPYLPYTVTYSICSSDMHLFNHSHHCPCYRSIDFPQTYTTWKMDSPRFSWKTFRGSQVPGLKLVWFLPGPCRADNVIIDALALMQTAGIGKHAPRYRPFHSYTKNPAYNKWAWMEDLQRTTLPSVFIYTCERVSVFVSVSP